MEKSIKWLEELEASDPANFYINWRKLDPIGFASARLGASWDEVRSMFDRNDPGRWAARKAHLRLVERVRDLCNLTDNQVRRYRYGLQ